MKNKLLILILIFGNIFSLNICQALTVSPVKLELSGDPGKTITGEINLTNEESQAKIFYPSFENFEPSGETGAPHFIGAKDGLASWMKTDEIKIKTIKEDKIATTTLEIIKPTLDLFVKLKNTTSIVTDILKNIFLEADNLAQNNLNAILEKMGINKNTLTEEKNKKDYLGLLIKDLKISNDNQSKLANFITYGTETTLILGAGERAGVLNSYKTVFNKLPNSQSEWEDVIKIANGRWPNERNKKAEKNAELIFEKIYKRKANRKNKNDDAAITIMTYGLRIGNRNLGSEKAAINSFKNIYKSLPKKTNEWDIVRAIAYSGAKR